MGWVWYYDDADFPVLQAVYPDLENRVPEDEGFDTAFQQPLMQPTAPMTRVEDDFWASAHPKSSLFNWKFTDPPHAHAYLSETVNNGTEHVTFVSHDAEDGAWEFLGDSMSDGGGPVVVCLHHPIDRDPSLAELADLPLGWYAERSELGRRGFEESACSTMRPTDQCSHFFDNQVRRRITTNGRVATSYGRRSQQNGRRTLERV